MCYACQEAKSYCYSHRLNPQITRIYQKLTKAFENQNSTTDDIDCTLEAMELITPLSKNEISKKSYNLLHIAM